jgi:hypothetical protein
MAHALLEDALFVLCVSAVGELDLQLTTAVLGIQGDGVDPLPLRPNRHEGSLHLGIVGSQDAVVAGIAEGVADSAPQVAARNRIAVIVGFAERWKNWNQKE